VNRQLTPSVEDGASGGLALASLPAGVIGYWPLDGCGPCWPTAAAPPPPRPRPPTVRAARGVHVVLGPAQGKPALDCLTMGLCSIRWQPASCRFSARAEGCRCTVVDMCHGDRATCQYTIDGALHDAMTNRATNQARAGAHSWTPKSPTGVSIPFGHRHSA
jgi:hypothetical protein